MVHLIINMVLYMKHKKTISNKYKILKYFLKIKIFPNFIQNFKMGENTFENKYQTFVKSESLSKLWQDIRTNASQSIFLSDAEKMKEMFFDPLKEQRAIQFNIFIFNYYEKIHLCFGVNNTMFFWDEEVSLVVTIP